MTCSVFGSQWRVYGCAWRRQERSIGRRLGSHIDRGGGEGNHAGPEQKRKRSTRLHIGASEHQAFSITPETGSCREYRAERQRRAGCIGIMVHYPNEGETPGCSASVASPHVYYWFRCHAAAQPYSLHRMFCPRRKSWSSRANTRNQARMALLTRLWKELIRELWRRADSNHYYAAVSLSGPPRGLFFHGYDSYAEWAQGSRGGGTTDPTVAVPSPTPQRPMAICSHQGLHRVGETRRLEPQSRLSRRHPR